MILVPPPRGLRIWQNFELVSSNTIHPKFKLMVLLRRFGWLCNEVCLFLMRCTRCKRWLVLPADGEDWEDGPAKDRLSPSLKQNTSLMLPWSIWNASSSSIMHPSSSTNLKLVLMSNFVFAIHLWFTFAKPLVSYILVITDDEWKWLTYLKIHLPTLMNTNSGNNTKYERRIFVIHVIPVLCYMST